MVDYQASERMSKGKTLNYMHVLQKALGGVWRSVGLGRMG